VSGGLLEFLWDADHQTFGEELDEAARRGTSYLDKTTHEVLLVEDDAAVRDMMNVTLERKGFDVVAAVRVAEALRLIATESFDVLITDLRLPNPGDGFTVVTAMRHSQPDALTLLVSCYPDVQRAMAAILLEADEVFEKPFEAGKCSSNTSTIPSQTGCPPTVSFVATLSTWSASAPCQRRITSLTSSACVMLLPRCDRFRKTIVGRMTFFTSLTIS
jgi:ActR/RegA family two-component response regulator